VGRSLDFSPSRLCVDNASQNLVAVALKVFLTLHFFMDTFYKLFTFSAICKDNSAINCSLKTKEGSFQSIVTSHATAAIL
jgi:hypothetical protein